MWLDKIKEMKERSGLTTREIAGQSGIPEPTLEKLFAGTTKDPKLGTVRELVHFLGYTLDDLEDEPIKKSPSWAEAKPGEDDSLLMEYIRKGLISFGFLREGQDFTDCQTEVVLATLRVWKAVFNQN